MVLAWLCPVTRKETKSAWERRIFKKGCTGGPRPSPVSSDSGGQSIVASSLKMFFCRFIASVTVD